MAEIERNFIHDIIDEDLREDPNLKIHTRFPPEPNGYLHIGSAKAIMINYQVAKKYNGQFNLRYDDTNPAKEDNEYVEAIYKDLNWLGATPDGGVFYGSVLFVIAIAIHNLPEGIAAGVSFGTGDVTQAITVAGGIALQNIPEGMVIIAPMVASGMSRGRTFVIAMMTGIVEVIGTFIGYFAVSVSNAILPFALAFAGGTMLYVISDEMIPETHAHGAERAATYALLAGFSVMLTFDFLLG